MIRNPKLITLTLRNTADLTTQIVQGLRIAMKNLFRRYESRIAGGFFAIEVEESGRGWHVHVHAVVDAYYIDQRALSDAWRAITHDSWIVDIRRAGSPTGALKYILKYLTKAPKLGAAAIPVYNTVLKGVRLIHPFGSLYAQWRGAPQRSLACSCCGPTTWTSMSFAALWMATEIGADATRATQGPVT